MQVNITQATVEDLPILAQINNSAYEPELLYKFGFLTWPDEVNGRLFFSGRIKEQFAHPTTRIFKATNPSSQEIIGLICFTYDDGVVGKPTPTTTSIKQVIHLLNVGFFKAVGAKYDALDLVGRGGTKHYHISTLAVSPKFQGQGIGSQLLKHCLKIADEDENQIPSWLMSFPGSHGLYLKLGFEDHEHCDIDLNEFDGFKFRGYGVYRTSAMFRKPQASAGIA